MIGFAICLERAVVPSAMDTSSAERPVMNVLVVTSHPLAQSLCARLTGRVVQRLEEAGHAVTLEDLYAQQFQPALTARERETYYADPYECTGVGEQVERLLSAEAVVLLFPTWWFGFPAILKGWFDRVWGPGIAYDHAEDFGPIRPRLHQLKVMMAITTLGAPRWVDRWVLRQPVKRVLKAGLLGACAPNSRFHYLALHQCERLTEEKIARFETRIDWALDRWA